MKVPTKVHNCPIVEAILEVRFGQSSVPDATIVGMLFEKFRGEFPELVPQDIASIPLEIRANSSEFAYQPHYHLVGPNGMILIAPRAIGITELAPYGGWVLFRERILRVITAVAASGIFEGPIRLGLRYLNFFPFDATGRLNVSVVHAQMSTSPETTVLKTRTRLGSFVVQLLVSNAATYNGKTGTIIDIDVVCTDLPSDFISDSRSVTDVVEKAHGIEKSTFFSTLSDGLIAELIPEYGE